MTSATRPFLFAAEVDGFDLDAYLDRIGFTGPRAATLDTLAGLHRLHLEAIPFENLDAVLGVPIHLDVGSLQRKLVHGRRGGYCFEQNLLFAHALGALGFRVTGWLARVLQDTSPDVVMPRTHMALRVHVDDAPYLADVGFGGQTLTRPVPLRAGTFPGTWLDTFRLRETGEGWTLDGHIEDAFVPLYRVDPQPQTRVDYDVANWYVSTHPESRMARQVRVSRWRADRRITLRGRQLTTLHVDGHRDREILHTASDVRSVLAHAFGIELPAGQGMDEALAGALASGDQA
jgi:N-hydroxyarylamine O-acetyltransferase